MNNIRHEPHEQEHLDFIRKQKLPVAEIVRHSELHEEEDANARLTLFSIGEAIEQSFPLKQRVKEKQYDGDPLS
ncbi:MAG: hypothetical protein WDN09_03015 [bacterium]